MASQAPSSSSNPLHQARLARTQASKKRQSAKQKNPVKHSPGDSSIGVACKSSSACLALFDSLWIAWDCFLRAPPVPSSPAATAQQQSFQVSASGTAEAAAAAAAAAAGIQIGSFATRGTTTSAITTSINSLLAAHRPAEAQAGTEPGQPAAAVQRPQCRLQKSRLGASCGVVAAAVAAAPAAVEVAIAAAAAAVGLCSCLRHP
eukprot:1161696-Pelagomonas_calceolata.AAC.8